LYVEPRRPLYPIRKERKKITGQSVMPEEVFILINVASAYDLAIRKDKIM
jgi:coiled-coil and C2 domain-containing protein 2A